MKIKSLLATGILTMSLLFSSGIVSAQDNSALIAQIQAQIAQLMAQLKVLQAQQSTDVAWCHTFNVGLGYANSGSDEVIALHTVLQKENISYNPDDNSSYTEATAHAVVVFQGKYGILQTGYVGLKTRAKLNALYGCGITPPLAQNQPLLKITPTALTQGQQYTFSGSVEKATPNSNIFFYLKGPNGTLEQNKVYIGLTDSLGNASITTTQTIWSGAQTGNYTGWVAVGTGDKKSNEITFTVSSTSDSSFRNAYYACYDGSVFNEDGSSSCKPSSLWKSYATQACQNKCSTVTGKCGVNTFSVSNPCSDSVQPSITVTSPNGGEAWKVGETHSITWNSVGVPSSAIMDFDLRDSSGNDVYDISSRGWGITNTGSYSWTVPAFTPSGAYRPWPGSGSYKMEIIAHAPTPGNPAQDIGNVAIDTSDNYFTIVAPTALAPVVCPAGMKSKLDVNGDGSITQADSQIITTFIQAHGSQAVSAYPTFGSYDVDSDGYISSQDVIKIINVVNAGSTSTCQPVATSSTALTGCQAGFKSEYDLNNDGTISSVDSQLIINFINSHSSSTDNRSVLTYPTYSKYDTDKDGYISSMDILKIINYINAGSGLNCAVGLNLQQSATASALDSIASLLEKIKEQIKLFHLP